jgi:alkylated DNA repair dioxygenase AlkB
MQQHTDLRDAGWLDYDRTFYTQEEADCLFASLRDETPWKQEQSRFGPFPRLTAWYADAGLTYTYSGVTHHALAWTPVLADVRCRVEEVAGVSFNSLLLNFYRDGKDSIGLHADAEPELGINPVITSISLGGVRRFVMKHAKSKERLTFDLAHGSLLIMGGTCQHHWLHGVPKTTALVEPRINLTFRRIAIASLSQKETPKDLRQKKSAKNRNN